MKKLTYRHTIVAGCIGFLVQAIVNNFAPLLFLTFQDTYGFSTGQIASLITVNFCFQLLVDFASTYFVPRLGLRACLVAAHLFSAVGLCGMAVLPSILPPYAGMLTAVLLYAAGSGLIEVAASPTVEACPTKNKASIMSMLHSFYCWGVVMTVLLSTLFFVTAGVGNWRWLACLWAALPLVNAVLFCFVPIYTLPGDETHKAPLRSLFSHKIFWLLALLMVTSGAAEQAMAQWASVFAEDALKVTKTVGDLAGPCAFAVLQGTARALYGKFGEKIPLRGFMLGSALLSIACYAVAALSASPVVGLVGCALCGFSVGIMWPGSLSIGSRALPNGGTALFSLLALFGDLGCSSGPGLVSVIADVSGGNMKLGLLGAGIFPLLMAVGLLFLQKKKKEKAAS